MISKNSSNKIKTTKTKIDDKIKDIVDQKIVLGLLAAKSDQSISAVDIKNALSFSLASVNTKNKKIYNLYGAIDSFSNHNISLENYTGANYLSVDGAAALRAVPKSLEDLAIKLRNDSVRYNV